MDERDLREWKAKLEDVLDRERALRIRIGNMRRALRQLNKAHATLWKVLRLHIERAAPSPAAQAEPRKCVACPDPSPGHCGNCPEDDPDRVADVASIIADAVRAAPSPAAEEPLITALRAQGWTGAAARIERDAQEIAEERAAYMRVLDLWNQQVKLCDKYLGELNAALRRAEALQEALRAKVIGPEGTGHVCNQCGSVWWTVDERHAPGCLASPAETKETK